MSGLGPYQKKRQKQKVPGDWGIFFSFKVYSEELLYNLLSKFFLEACTEIDIEHRNEF